MKLEEASKLAQQYLYLRGLSQRGWTFSFKKMLTRFGECDYRHKTITLSSTLTPHRDDASVFNTIMHEIAHAVVGYGHGHDEVWRATAISLGCDGRRCSEDKQAGIMVSKWHLICDKCGIKYPAYRRPRVTKYHIPCGPTSKLVLAENTLKQAQEEMGDMNNYQEPK